MAELQANETVKNFVDRRDTYILKHFEMVVNTVIMEEALQQKEAHSMSCAIIGSYVNEKLRKCQK